MTTNLAASCFAKIARADAHLKVLYHETAAWGDSNPISIVRESNADGSQHLFRLRYRISPDVWRWALVLGDSLHNLRCALDHIVYALAVDNTRLDPPSDERILGFPICSNSDYFARSKHKIQSLSTDAQTAVERLQPYNRVKLGQWFMPLWWLAGLNDVDKHRMSHLSAIAAVPDEIAIDADPGTYVVEWNRGPLVDGAPVLRITLTEPDPHVRVDLHVTGGVSVKLIDIPPWGLYHLTRRIRREVAVACRYLSRFFE